MIDQKLIDRINELARKKTLTPEEKAEQIELRKQYVKLFKEGFRQQLESIRVIDKDGNDVTPTKPILDEIRRKQNG